MRVISGSLRGRQLKTIDGRDVRPTTDKVKESIFNIIQFDLAGADVLDLFAGSGQLGIEALSRGAERCTFVEQDRQAVSAIEYNLNTCKLSSNEAHLHRGDAFAFLSAQKPASFDIILLDPPYGGGLLTRAINDIGRFDILTDDGIIICEKASNDDFGGLPEGLYVQKEYKYGKITLCKIRREGAL